MVAHLSALSLLAACSSSGTSTEHGDAAATPDGSVHKGDGGAGHAEGGPGLLSITGSGFGTVSLGQASSATLHLKNTGGASLTLSAPTIAGSGAASFTVASKPSSMSLAPGASATLGIEFRPTAFGATSATLDVANTGGQSPATFALAGTGGCPVPPYDLSKLGSAGTAACVGSLAVVVGNESLRGVSSDGTHWGDITLGAHPTCIWSSDAGAYKNCGFDDGAFEIAFGQGLIVTASDFGIYTSANGGKSWTLAPPPAPQQWGEGVHVSVVGYGNGFFLISDGTNHFRSSDGYLWDKFVFSTGGDHVAFGGMAFQNGKFVVVSTIIAITEDGIHWQSVPNPTAYASIAAAAGVFVAGAPNGILQSSPDGVTWTDVTPKCDGGTCLGMYTTSVVSDGKTFWASASDAVMTSTDGKTWTTVGKGHALSAAGNGLLFGVSYPGNVSVSSDNGTTWSAVMVGEPDGGGPQGIGVGSAIIASGSDAGAPVGMDASVSAGDGGAAPHFACASDAGFGFAQDYLGGNTTAAETYLAVGDFNGDGITDVAVACIDGTVNLFQATAAGKWGTPVVYDAGLGHVYVTTADLEKAGRTDVLTLDNVGNRVLIYKTSVGTSLTGVASASYPTGTSPTRLAVADFNGDGTLDLAVTNAADGTVGTLLGQSGGTFASMVASPAGADPTGLAVGDFNGDGKPDLAVTNLGQGTVSVLLGVGDGTFSSPATYPVGSSPLTVAVGDLRHAGRQDLVVANSQSNTLSVLLGDGAGSFAPAVSLKTDQNPEAVSIRDLNGDGVLDLAVANAGPTYDLTVFRGKGDGTFTLFSHYPVQPAPFNVVAASIVDGGAPNLFSSSQYMNWGALSNTCP